MTPVLPQLLLADIGEIIGAIMMVLFLVLWVIGQLVEGKKQLGQPPRGPAGAPPQVPQQRPAAPQPGKPPVAGGLRGEMEEFLRRAAGQAQAQQAKPAGAPPRRQQPAKADSIEVLVEEPKAATERRRLVEPAQPLEPRVPSSPRTPAAKPIPPRPPKKAGKAKRETLAEHVSQHIGAKGQAMAAQAARLGQRIAQEDAQFDVQLKAKFDHDVGSLASTTRMTDTPSQSPDRKDTTSAAGQLSAMLSTPEGLRQAFVVNEILRRPSERW